MNLKIISMKLSWFVVFLLGIYLENFKNNVILVFLINGKFRWREMDELQI